MSQSARGLNRLENHRETGYTRSMGQEITLSRILRQSTGHSERGSATVEFGLILLPLLAFTFLLIDTSWLIFARATLQHAAREGVRFGVTGRIVPLASCLGDSIRQVVVAQSFGFVPGNLAPSMVAITYYNPSTLAVETGSGSTAGGNVIQVSISGLNVPSLAPLWYSASPISLGAAASDVLESPPNGILPCP